MRKTPQRTKPAYLLDSVDNALRLIEMLRDQGSFRLTEAAAELGVAASTAHRLLAGLVYRGFALQDESRRYLPGPALGVGPARLSWSREVRDLAGPHLDLLCTRLDETVNLMIRVGTQVRFLDTVEARRVLRIGDREGQVLPARFASGGKALLAALSPDVLARLYRDPRGARSGEYLDDREYAALTRTLDEVRRQGYALNSEETEEGVMALGVALSGAGGRHIAAISVACPRVRFASLMGQGLPDLVRETKIEIEADLARHQVDGDTQAARGPTS